jgi:hypothetical protein
LDELTVNRANITSFSSPIIAKTGINGKDVGKFLKGAFEISYVATRKKFINQKSCC